MLTEKEYGEDTCWRALTPATQQAARRRSIIVFKRTPEGVQQEIFVGFWEETWDEVAAFLNSGNGGDIAVNRSKAFAFADGMASGEFDAFEEGVGPEVMARVKYPELLPIYFLMIRAPSMLPHYKDACELSHSVMCEAMSNNVIVPGETTTDDVSWWMWQRSIDLGFECWFQPSFGVQRAGVQGTLGGDTIIERGDFLWTDYGIDYAGMMTDQQHMGYVCHLGESGPPQGLIDGLKKTNWMQNTILEEMQVRTTDRSAIYLPSVDSRLHNLSADDRFRLPRPWQVGRTGNEVLAKFDERMRAEGIDGKMYSHAIGDHGHAAGPTIGLADMNNQPVPVKGDVGVLRDEMWYAVELSCSATVPEWGQQIVQFRQEENGVISTTGVNHFAFRRQDVLHVVH